MDEQTFDDPLLDQESAPYVGRWNQLVSTTNWEKGRIIFDWRDALQSAGVAVTEYSDEAWARRVGAITGQHVGRLRRVYERFGSNYEDFAGLYWSHFQAALDWSDAEMWLEGVVQNNWSVSQMRQQRWEALGAVDKDLPRDVDIITAELNEDFEPIADDLSADTLVVPTHEEVHEVSAPAGSAVDDLYESEMASGDGATVFSDEPKEEMVPFIRPFENLDAFPEDVSESFESFKLVILRHKSEGWREMTRDDLLAALDALKELALAPATETSPF